MKKLVFAFAAFAAISFASCGNKTTNKAESTDSTAVEVVAETADSTACCEHDHAHCDSTKVAE